jgi:hypothetical protein
VGDPPGLRTVSSATDRMKTETSFVTETTPGLYEALGGIHQSFVQLRIGIRNKTGRWLRTVSSATDCTKRYRLYKALGGLPQCFVQSYLVLNTCTGKTSKVEGLRTVSSATDIQ